jgi:hypothetical protein
MRVIKTVTHSLSATRERSSTRLSIGLRARFGESSARSSDARAARSKRGAIARAITHVPFPALRGYVRRFAQESIEEHWALGIIHKPVHHVVRSFDERHQWLAPPQRGAIADPLGALEPNGRLTILAEATASMIATDASSRSKSSAGASLPGRVGASRSAYLYRTSLLTAHRSAACGGGFGVCVTLSRRPVPRRWVPDRILLKASPAPMPVIGTPDSGGCS